MDDIFKLCAAGLISLVLMLLMDKQEKYITVLISIAVCAMLLAASAEFLQPIIRLMRQLQRTAMLETGMFSALLKAVGASVVCEMSSLICMESGYSALGKALQNTAMAVILYFSLPLFSELLDLITELLGGL